ncbi:O-methylsterigmatocystin oxidoreductase [Mycena venus]|uniref:O-methylsterigmatocystin oxidoreductase n=1 Tax=Mycena venus TaxID=2733690 RepID=A0A8H6YGK5_9AGAR|nr:O-methylsterigmatocystin oxidoreductase [Mycena venus]
MGSYIGLPVLASSAALCIGISYYLSQRSTKPPGPRGWPIIGNLFGVPTEFEWLHWTTYKELYGAVSYTTVLGKEIVILNTLEACNDMLEKRSSAYSGRPIMPFAGEIVGWDQQLVLATYGKHFRTMRKLAHHHLGTKAAAVAYHEVQETEVKYLISRLHRDPEGLVKNLRITIGAILLRMSHGYITRIDGNDPIVNLIEIAAQDFYQATKPGAWLVDIIPWLKHIPAWVPGAGFMKTGAKYRKTNVDQTDLPYNFVLKELNNGTALPSFTSNALRSGELTAEEKYAVKYIATALYGSGLDTITAAITVFVLAMVLFPDVQRKAREELDSVVGTNRLPTMQDQEHLPYIAAIQKEISRWRTIVPGGIPHAATEDDVYNGFSIRKGTIIVNNLWAIAHDPDNYEDPMAFKPERFLGDAPELDPGIFTFGFGRRRCPGIEVAESTVFIIMATFLSVFRFENAKDEAGNEVPPLVEFDSGTVCHPKPFKCSIEPLSANTLHLLQTLESELPERPPSQL